MSALPLAPTDIFAPGVGVVSSLLGGGSTTASGTSMASPSAAGCAALLIDAGEATTPQAILDRLQTSPVGVAAANGTTYPRVDCGNDQATVLPQPCVLHDSRQAQGALAGPIPGGATRTLQVSGSIPNGQQPGVGSCIDGDAGATAAILLVTAIEPSSVGNLRVSAAGVPATGGVVNYTSNGLNNANTITVPLSADGQIDVFANVSATGVRVVALGYYGPTGPLDFVPLTPCAAFDSRNGVGQFAGPYVEDATPPIVDVVGFFSPDQGAGVTDCGVPAGAHSIMANLVVIRPPGGFGGRGSIGASPGSVIPSEPMTPFADLILNNATSVVVPLAGGQTVRTRLFEIEGETSGHVRLVILGYFTEQEAEQYVPITPCAAFDSRSGSGAFAGKRSDGTGGVTTYDVVGAMPAAQGAGTNCGVPNGAGAVLV
ncbi:MAG: S8 family serine peptidase, partial [Actinomycetota bacterium]